MNRLPKSVVPIQYVVHFTPKNDQVFGSCLLTVDVLQEEKKIILNSIDIKYHSIKIMNEKDEKIDNFEFNMDISDQIIIIGFEKPLGIGKYKLEFEYQFSVKNTGRGFYFCDFDDVKGYSTHFEPCDARSAFPCFDEPSIKAKFQLKVTISKKFQVITNTDVKEIIEGDLNTHIFYETPIMSTYLFACIIGKFDTLETKVKNTIVRVNVPLGMKDQGLYALDLAKKCLEFYSEKFEQDYILPKLDLVAVDEIDALAEENFGCITFQRDYFCVENSTPLSRRQRIARLIFHEIGHQWFGNLVGIQWWKYIWVKEGFARFLEYELVNHFFPEWNYWCHFIVEIYQNAMEKDNKNTHPIETDIDRAEDVKDYFDIISYGKGASVLRMLFGYIGKDLMWKSIAHFIKKYQYKSTSTEDLWDSISTVTNIDIQSFMDDWIKQPDYPILICENDEIKYKGDRKIPILINNNGKITPFLLDKNKFTLEKDVKINHNHISFIRIKYSKSIIENLVNLKLTQEDCIGIFMDSLYFFKLPSDHELKISFEEFTKILELVIRPNIKFIPEFQIIVEGVTIRLFYLSQEYISHQKLKEKFLKIFQNTQFDNILAVLEKEEKEVN